jgi:lysophospholipase L1-like esterase
LNQAVLAGSLRRIPRLATQFAEETVRDVRRTYAGLDRTTRARLVQGAVAIVLVLALTVTSAGDRRFEREAIPPPLPSAPVRTASEPGAGLEGERVLFLGDSLAFATSPYLAHRLEAAGAHYEAETVGGSGLLDHDDIDWPTRAAQLVLVHRPTTVIVEFCCNYALPYAVDADGRTILPGSEAFRELWAAKAAQLADAVTADGARLYWVVTPPAPPRQTVIDDINATTIAASLRADPPIRLIRWDLALTGGTGRYQSAVDVDGRPVTIRDPDRLHLNPAGADLAAKATVDLLLADGPGRWGPFDRPEALALQVRRDFAGTTVATPDPAADAEGARLVNGEQTVAGLVRDVAYGERWGAIGAPLIRLHSIVTGSLPDDAWLRQAMARSHEGVTPGDEAVRLMDADRDPSWLDLDDADFVDRLHERAYGRAADRAEHRSLDGRVGSRAERADAIGGAVASTEAEAHAAGPVGTALLIIGLLHRSPTVEEVDRWAPAVAAGDVGPLVDALIGSDEYAARLPTVRNAPVGTGVVGGLPIRPGDAPWLVSLVERGRAPGAGMICAGALVEPSWVATTAACVGRRPPSTFDVVIGDRSSDQQPDEVIPVEWFRIDNQETTTLDGGPMLLRLRTPSRHQPIAMALDDENAAAGPVSVVGWSQGLDGRVGPPHRIDLGDGRDEGCLASYGDAFSVGSMMCAGLRTGGMDVCQGGAPVVTGTGIDRRLLGLVGWGVGCGRPGGPAVAVRLSASRDALDVTPYLPPFATPTQATVALYQAVLDRPPNGDELARWTADLESGTTSPSDLGAWLTSSGENDTLPALVRWWVGLFGAPPPDGSLGILRINSRFATTSEDALPSVAELPEVEARLAEGDDRSFVTRTWASTMGTEPTPADVAAAIRQLARPRVSRADLVLSWANGADGRRHLQPAADAVLLTAAVLQRPTTAAEFEAWVTSVRGGGSTRERVERLLRAEELVDRY